MRAETVEERAVDYTDESLAPPTTWKGKLKMVGPGFVTAATGVGTGDLIAALVAGAGFGMTLIWAIVVGAIFKYFFTEGMGRWHLATGRTILEGFHSLGKWATGYFGVYAILWGLSYGAAAMSTSAIMMVTMFPIMPLWAWAIIHGLAGMALVLTGKYKLFERIMTVMIGIMFITVVGSAVILLPNIGDILSGFVPRTGDGSLLLVMGLLGGVGGTITMASYGYWIRENKWQGSKWIPMMKLDSAIGYVITGIFTVSLLVIGAEFLYGSGIEINGEEGLVTLSSMFSNEFGEVARWMFLIGAWSAAFSSLLGVWNGVPYLFADFVRMLRGKAEKTVKPISEKDPAYRAYLLWLTFPPMLLLFFDKPVFLVILYGALGALFMPFLAITLLWLLNSNRVESAYKNGWLANIVLICCVLMFGYLSIVELINMF
ncbi:Nramp family divalent metal transporter [Virgibacillus salexigens]|uniref:Divalent metal cation transporter MntH n=2 Tax=Virgibacillus TaxID=84406 RepID=A0A024QIG5_9BACI|nr:MULTISPECIES: Nramp family divalent metal transporter [Virgibacillus]MYL43129.1 divalent metal cation transporter [Virgibacillus massiliensis]GGJ64849.1 iron transporter [Virgibacillus kapii]CDQ41960.1 Divalent metal cation transporter MntH [Virgibacillus massiliensis]